MKRKWLAILLSLVLCVSLFSGMTLAADEEEPVKEPALEAEEIPDEEGIETVYIDASIAVAGELVLAHYPVLVADEDEDGAYTVYDALVAIHGSYYEGDDGFAVNDDGFITKLWGVENGGSYGYYLNNVMCGGIKDPIEEDDYLVAYTFADLENWSDMYTYFNTTETEIFWNEKVTLQLMGIAFDEDWNTVEVPVEGAVITIDGEKTEFVTDEAGTVTFTLPEDSFDSYYEISAVMEDKVIVPPAMDVWVDYSNYHEREFTDVGGHWAEDAIYNMVEEGYLNGVSETEFAPDANVSRAMIAAVLYRMFDEPASEGENTFTDVAEDTWYTDAVIWAAENEIVKGSEGKYRPDDALTRSEAAVILYRWVKAYIDSNTDYYRDYALSLVVQDILEADPDFDFDTREELMAYIEKDEELSAELQKLYTVVDEHFAAVVEVDAAELEGFADAEEIQDWAEEAMAWAVTQGILTGTSDTAVSPAMTLTRAQLAVILDRMLDVLFG